MLFSLRYIWGQGSDIAVFIYLLTRNSFKNKQVVVVIVVIIVIIVVVIVAAVVVGADDTAPSKFLSNTTQPLLEVVILRSIVFLSTLAEKPQMHFS